MKRRLSAGGHFVATKEGELEHELATAWILIFVWFKFLPISWVVVSTKITRFYMLVHSKITTLFKGTMCCLWSLTSFFVYISNKLLIYVRGILYTILPMPLILTVTFVYLLEPIQMTLKKYLFSFNVCLVCLQVSKINYVFVKMGH